MTPEAATVAERIIDAELDDIISDLWDQEPT